MFKQLKKIFQKKEESAVAIAEEIGIIVSYGDSLFAGINPDSSLDDYAQMRYDEQVNVCLETRLMAIMANGFEIIPAQGQEKIAEEIETMFNNLDNSFLTKVKQMELVKKVYGFSISEIIWELKESKYVIENIKTLDSLTVKFFPDVFGELLEDGIQQQTGMGWIWLPIEKFILHINNYEAGNHYGISELKPSLEAWFIKTKLKTLYTQLLERYGIPPVIVKYDPTDFVGQTVVAAKNAITETAQQIKRTHQGGVIMIPNTYEHDIVQLDAQAGGAFEVALARYDFAITKGLKVPAELGFLEVKTGSNAKATTQFEFFMMIVNQDKSSLEETINQQLIKRYCNYNYGTLKEYPKIKFKASTNKDIHAIIKSYNESLASGAIRSTKEGENKILDMLGFPEVNEDDIIEQIVPAPPIEDTKKKIFSANAEMTPIEQTVNFNDIKNFLDKTENKTIKDFFAIANMTINDMIVTIVDKKIISNRNIGEINKLIIDSKFEDDVKALFSEMMQQGYKEGVKTINSELKKKVVFAKQDLPQPEYYLWVNSLTETIAGELAGMYLAETKKTLLIGIEQGLSESKIIKVLKEIYTAQGDTSVSNGRIGTIVRTNLNASFNKARQNEIVEIQQETGDVYYKVFSEILDGRNHPFSAAINGKAVKVGTDLDRRLSYPMHYNDRGLAIYVHAGAEGKPPNIITEMPPLSIYSGLLIQ